MPPHARAVRSDAGTASQLIRGVRRTGVGARRRGPTRTIRESSPRSMLIPPEGAASGCRAGMAGVAVRVIAESHGHPVFIDQGTNVGAPSVCPAGAGSACVPASAGGGRHPRCVGTSNAILWTKAVGSMWRHDAELSRRFPPHSSSIGPPAWGHSSQHHEPSVPDGPSAEQAADRGVGSPGASGRDGARPPNKRMKLTKLSAAPLPGWTVPPHARAGKVWTRAPLRSLSPGWSQVNDATYRP